jgi:hypothetical protein
MKSRKEDTENKQKSGQLIEEMVEEHNEEIWEQKRNPTIE